MPKLIAEEAQRFVAGESVLNANQVVTVFGAYGHTGRFVVAELRRRGMRPILSGRDAKQLAELAGTHWNFPPPFGKQEVIGELSTVDVVTIPRHLRTQKISAYLNTAPLKDLSDPDAPGPEAADERGRSSQTFLVDVVARRGHESRRAFSRGRDIYAITAPIVVEAVERILSGRIKRSGIGAAAEIFEAEDFLLALARDPSFETTAAPVDIFHSA